MAPLALGRKSKQSVILSLNDRGRPHVTPFPQQGYGSLGPGWLGLGIASPEA